jgi:hypothetical protein
MAYCPDCGVEIGDAPACPLCGARNPRAAARGAAPECVPCEDARPSTSRFSSFLGENADAKLFTRREKRKIAWEVITVALSIATVGLFLINFLVSARLSWSRYPVSAFVFIAIMAAAFLIMDESRPWRYFVACLDLPAFLLALGFFTENVGWAWRLAVPLAIFTELAAAAVALMISNAKRKGLNILAYALIGAAIECLGIEMFIDLFVVGRIWLVWSTITAVSLIPIAVFLLYLHYRVAKSTNLRRLFKL